MKDYDVVKKLIAELKAQTTTPSELHRVEVLESDFFNPPKAEVIDDNKQSFNSVVYNKKKDGHYHSHNGIHRAVWQYFNGEVPQGHEIHHIDWNPSNNEISNLQLMTISEHRSLHSQHQTKKEFTCANCGKKYFAVDFKVNRFCSKKCCQNFHNHKPKIIKYCQVCGKEIEDTATGIKKYCSEKCRREASYQKYTEVRVCEECGKEFSVNRYRPTKYCSHTCHMKARHKSEQVS